MVVYATDAGVFLLNLVMSIGTWNILVAKCSNSVAALLLARKHSDSLMGKDIPWPLHLAGLSLQAAHLLFLFLTLLVSCSSQEPVSKLPISTSIPLAPVFGPVQISLRRLLLPALPPGSFPLLLVPCPQPPSHPHPGVLSLAWPLQLLCFSALPR